MLKPLHKNYYNEYLNAARWQDTRLIYRTQLHFFTLTIKYQKEKAKKQNKTKKTPQNSCLKLHKNKKLGINLTEEVKEVYVEKYKTLTEESVIQRSGKVSVLLDWKN